MLTIDLTRILQHLWLSSDNRGPFLRGPAAQRFAAGNPTPTSSAASAGKQLQAPQARRITRVAGVDQALATSSTRVCTCPDSPQRVAVRSRRGRVNSTVRCPSRLAARRNNLILLAL